MFITPAEMIPITSLCTFIATVAAFRIQRFYSRRDAEVDYRRRLEEKQHAELTSVAVFPRRRAVERDEAAKVKLLGLFAESTHELRMTCVPLWDFADDHHESSRFRRESLWQSTRVDNRIETEAAQLSPMILDQDLRLLLTICADIVAHWDELDTEHGPHALFQTTVARICAEWAVRAIACSLRQDELPTCDPILSKRVDGSGRAKRVWFSSESQVRSGPPDEELMALLELEAILAGNSDNSVAAGNDTSKALPARADERGAPPTFR